MADPAVDLTSLTPEQQEALQLFTSVTDQDLPTALPILQRCQWNTQIAITRFFDGDADTVDPAAEAAAAPPPQDPRRTETLLDNIPSRTSSRSRAGGDLEPAPRVVPTPESQLTQPLPFPFSILFLPFNLTYTIFQRVFGVVGYLFPFIPRLLSRLYSGRASQPTRDTGRRPLNPRDTAARFIREFEEDHGVTHGTLPFYEGGYAQAFDAAKQNLQYLVVLLLSPEHDDTAPFVRDTLLSPDIIHFLQHPPHPLLLWAGSLRDPEAYQVANALNATRFPYTTLVAHTPSISSTAMSKLITTTGPLPPTDLITKLTTAMTTHAPSLTRLRAQRAEQSASRSLRAEQESAYERSLAADREKARLKRAEAQAAEKAERETRDRAERKADLARKRAQWRRWRGGQVASEPAADADAKNVVRVSLRMPDGKRVVRRFEAGCELEELYAFVECYDDVVARESGEGEEKVMPEPEGYVHRYGFQLVSPMPREVFGLGDGEGKGGKLGQRVGRSGNLIVERDLENDEDDEDEDENEDGQEGLEG